MENLLDYPDMETEQRDRFVGIIRDEVGVMGQRLDRTVTEFADAFKARWPLEDMLGVDLVQAAQRRSRAEGRHPDQDGGGGRGAVGKGG